MAARIPQMYQPPRHASPPSPDSPTSGLGINPFAGSTDTLGAPVHNVARESTNLSNIGGLLLRDSGAWSAVGDDDAELPAVVRTGNRARSSTIITADRYAQVDRAALHARVRDLEDDYDDHDPMMSDDESEYDHDRDSRPINAGAIGGLGLGALSSGPTQALQVGRAPTPDPSSVAAPVLVQPKPQPQIQTQPTVHRAPIQGPASPTHHYHHQNRQPERPSVVVNFPTPNIVPSAAPTWGPPTPITPSHPNPNAAFANGGKPKPQRPHVQLPVKLPIMSNAQPVSPMLAAPPKAHFSSSNMTPPASPSLRGFDSMKEKSATFREDDTEVMNPFSPNARQAGPRGVGRSNLNPNGRKSGVRPYTTVDFWKRFSTMGRVNDGSKESGWMTERKRSIWKKPLFVFPLIITLLAVGAIITYVVIKVLNTRSTGEAMDAILPSAKA